MAIDVHPHGAPPAARAPRPPDPRRPSRPSGPPGPGEWPGLDRSEGAGSHPAALAGAGRLAGLDGLRALAVLAVIVFHLHPSWLPGGFLGVDVFFVISGFLITTLLIREYRRHGWIDLVGFWTRRARRLLPALAACVAASTLVAAVVQRDLLVGIVRQTLGALTFTSNWLEIAAGSDYFHATTPQLFMNLWSLAVEEQFYLLWPLATLVLLREVRSGLHRAAIPLAVGVGSALLMAVLLDPGAPTRVYYGTDTHLVGLMLGAALAIAYAAPHRAWTATPQWAQARRYLVPGAALTMTALLFTLDESNPFTFRGGIALASVATAMLMLAAVADPGVPRTVLDARVLGWIGERSYGIYLWHWPVILVVDQLWETTPGNVAFVLNRGVALGLTLAVAQASYRWIETPVRRNGFRATWRMLRASFHRLSGRPLQLARATVVLAILAWVGVLATAPAQTSTERMLRENAATLPAAATTDTPSTAPAAPGASTAAAAPAPSGTVPAGATAPAPPTPDPQVAADARQASFTMPTGSEIDVFGDSMVIGSIPALRYWFPGIRIDARSNTRWKNGLARVRAHGATLRRAVVLGYGTNAGVDAAIVEQVIATIGPTRMIVLVTEHGPFSRVESDNAALRRIAAAHPNVVIADWDAALDGTRGQLQSDGIHPSLKGQHLWAKTVRAALATLSQEHTGVRVALPGTPPR